MQNKTKCTLVSSNDITSLKTDCVVDDRLKKATTYEILPANNYKFPKTHKSFPLFIEV